MRQCWLPLFALLVCAGCQSLDLDLEQPGEIESPMPKGWERLMGLEERPYPVTSIEFTPDGKRIVTTDSGNDSWAMEDGARYQLRYIPPAQIRVWSLNDRDSWHDNPVNISHTPGTIFQRRAFLNATDNTIIARTSVEKVNDGYGVWNLQTGKLIETVKEPDDAPSFGVVSGSRKNIIWADQPGSLLVHHIQGGTRERLSYPNLGRVELSAVSHDDSMIVATRPLDDSDDSQQTELFIVDLPQHTILNRFLVTEQRLSNVTFSPDSRYLAASVWCAGRTYVFDIKEGRKIATLNTDGVVWSLAFSPDSRQLVVGAEVDNGEAAQAVVWNCDTWKQVTSWRDSNLWGFTALAFSLDGSKLAVGQSDGKVSLVAVPQPK